MPKGDGKEDKDKDKSKNPFAVMAKGSDKSKLRGFVEETVQPKSFAAAQGPILKNQATRNYEQLLKFMLDEKNSGNWDVDLEKNKIIIKRPKNEYSIDTLMQNVQMDYLELSADMHADYAKFIHKCYPWPGMLPLPAGPELNDGSYIKEARNYDEMNNPDRKRKTTAPLLEDFTEREEKAVKEHGNRYHILPETTYAEKLAICAYTTEAYKQFNTFARTRSIQKAAKTFHEDAQVDTKLLLLLCMSNLAFTTSGINKRSVDNPSSNEEMENIAIRSEADLPQSIIEQRIKALKKNKVMHEAAFSSANPDWLTRVSGKLSENGTLTKVNSVVIFQNPDGSPLRGGYIGDLHKNGRQENEFLLPPGNFQWTGHKRIDGVHYFVVSPVSGPVHKISRKDVVIDFVVKRLNAERNSIKKRAVTVATAFKSIVPESVTKVAATTKTMYKEHLKINKLINSKTVKNTTGFLKYAGKKIQKNITKEYPPPGSPKGP